MLGLVIAVMNPELRGLGEGSWEGTTGMKFEIGRTVEVGCSVVYEEGNTMVRAESSP